MPSTSALRLVMAPSSFSKILFNKDVVRSSSEISSRRIGYMVQNFCINHNCKEYFSQFRFSVILT